MERQTIPQDSIVKRSQLAMIWRRFLRNKTALIGLIMLLFIILLSVSAPLYIDYEGSALEHNIRDKRLPPGGDHILGTDQFGRDLFARVIYGARISLLLGFASIGIAVLIGSAIGAIAGYYGGKIDNILMRIMDVFLAIPHVLMAMVIVAALGAGIQNLLVAMAISSTPKFSRIVRSAVISLRDQLYVEAARSCGAKDRWIIMRHIIPNALGPIIVQATLGLAQNILNISFLSYLGLGVPSPMPEWGAMLAESKDFMRTSPYMIMIPGCAIILTVLSLNLMGDGLRDALDPKLKN